MKRRGHGSVSVLYQFNIDKKGGNYVPVRYQIVTYIDWLDIYFTSSATCSVTSESGGFDLAASHSIIQFVIMQGEMRTDYVQRMEHESRL